MMRLIKKSDCGQEDTQLIDRQFGRVGWRRCCRNILRRATGPRSSKTMGAFADPECALPEKCDRGGLQQPAKPCHDWLSHPMLSR